jgi:hypothetical protein
MLTSRHIPQHLMSEPGDWQRFLDKAAKGSYKAVEMLDAADLAYMSALSHDPRASRQDHYQSLFRKRFPRSPPASNPQGLFALCLKHGYFATPLRIEAAPRLPATAYCNLWAAGKPVPVDTLVHDAVLACFNRWSPDLCIGEPGDTDYDSLAVVTSMLTFCISWPVNVPVAAR